MYHTAVLLKKLEMVACALKIIINIKTHTKKVVIATVLTIVQYHTELQSSLQVSTVVTIRYSSYITFNVKPRLLVMIMLH